MLVLSSSPTVVQDDIAVDLPAVRDQLTTRRDPRFTELRARVYGRIQRAKRGGARDVDPADDQTGGPDPAVGGPAPR